MNKTKVIAFVLVLSIILMGAGYAYWTDSIQLNTTVSTGEFNVKFYKPLEPWVKDKSVKVKATDDSDIVLAEADIDPELFPDNIIGIPYPEPPCNPDPQYYADVLTATFSNVYPGIRMFVPVQVKNIGSIPAVFDYAEVKFYLEDAEGDYQPVEVDDEEFNALISEFKIKNLRYKKYNELGKLYGDNGDPVRVNNVNFSNLENKLNTLLSGVELLPFDYLNMCEDDEYGIEPFIKFELSHTVEEKNLCDQGIRFDIILHWTQFNDPEAPINQP
ncbi:hypothetical protein [Vallitalea okinawensis]|uniref:hypothetical protein n=1 Tax=Vallitalea okinawensis TaxID=2078660 RepID=UPI000CFC4988|nr:hypothetical protein [Vallitalea okinawensis]